MEGTTKRSELTSTGRIEALIRLIDRALREVVEIQAADRMQVGDLLLEATKQIDRLTSERDDVRRRYCRDVWHGIGDEDECIRLSPKEVADREGWYGLFRDDASKSTEVK
jgi:hypothetical protein